MKALFSTHLARYFFLSFFLVAGVLQNGFSQDLQVIPLKEITIEPSSGSRDAWYILDAGTPDYIAAVPGVDLMWLNGFEIIPGAGIIDQIGVFWGAVPDGMKARLILYNDPDNDGNPDDAVYLAEHEVDIQQMQYIDYDFPPTPISNKFFVAALFSDTTTIGGSPAPMLWDDDWYSQASWIASSTLGDFDVTNLTNNSQPPALLHLFFPTVPGDFIIRAHGTSMPEVPVLIIDMDGNTNSGPVMAGVLDDLSIQYDYQTYFPRNPLQDYLSVFVYLGVYNLNHQLTASEGQLLADYLNSGGRLYMEGGNTWCLDPQRVVHPMFNIDGVSYGAADMGPLNGMFGTFTDCMSFTYSGDNNFMDRIDAIPPAFQIFQNLTPSYYAGVAYDAGYYKTIGASFEFGGLDDASYPSTKAELMTRYLEFFDVPVPLISVEPDFLRAYLVSGQNDSSLIKLNNSSATVDSYQVGIQYTDEAGVPLLPAVPQFPEQHTQPPKDNPPVKFRDGERPSSGLAPPTNAYVKKSPSTRNTMAPTSKAFAYNVNANSSSDPLGPMSFYLNNPGNVTNIGPALPNFVAAADWANGKWYGVTYTNWDLIQLDTATGNYTTIGAPGIFDLTSLAWDRTTGTMYTVSFAGNLYSLDMATGNPTFIAATRPYIISLAVTNDGTLYGIDILNDEFGSINKTTGAWTTISSLPFNANLAQDMAIDKDDNKIYYAAFNVSRNGGQLYYINHATGSLTYIDDFEGGMHVAGFAIPCVEWLTVDPLAGIIGPYGSANVNAHYNAAGLSSGDYYANLNIYFSNPDSTITVPVHLTVGEPEINVEPTTIYLHPTHPLPPPPPIANTIDQPGAPVTGLAQNTKKVDYIPGQMLLKFSDDVIVNEGRAVTNYDQINELLREYRISKMKQLFKQNGINEALKKEMGLHSIYVVNFAKSRDVFTVVNAFKALRQVVYAEPDYLAYADIIPPDPMFPDQWALQNTGQVVPAGRTVGTPGADIGAVMAWDMETGNSSVTVAVIDEGVDLTHPEFAGRLLPGYDFFNDDSDPSPFQNDAHGTACAGIVGAAQDGVGVVGVAWGVNILPVKVMELGTGPWSAISGGIVFSADQGADILSMSLGGTSYSSTLNSAVNYAYFSGAVLIAAAGNDNTDNGIVPHYPASFSNVISIGALSPCNNRKSPSTCDGENWWGSNYGGGLDFLAPGVRIPTTDIVGAAGYSSTNYIATFNGTSSACPYAAGVAALVLSHNPLLSASSVRYLLRSSCVDLGTSGYDDDTGYGRLDAYMALLYAGGANSFEIFNQGTGPLTITSITDNQDWLSTNIPPGPGQTISTSGRGAGGATWDEVVAFNDVLFYDTEGEEPSTGRDPGGKKPIILDNPNPNARGMSTHSFAYNANSSGSSEPEGPLSFNLTSPEDVTIIGPELYNSDFVSCAAWANGIWYGVTFNGDSLITLDTTNGSYFKIAQTTHAEAMAWDPTTNTMYISKWNALLSVSELYTIDLITGVTTLIGSNSVLIIGMACTNEGDLYAIDIFNDEFGSVNKATAAWSPISSLPFDANFTQDLTIDREDNKLYYAAYNYSVGAGQLWTIDHLSGVLTYISTFEDGIMVCGFIIPTNIGRKIQPNESLLVNTFIDWNLIGTTRSRSTGTVTILSDDGDEPTVTVTVNVSTDSIRSNTVIEDDTIHNTEDECFEGQYVIIAGGDGKTFVVENGGSTTLVAGRRVLLKPGVKVEQGGYLHAYISTNGLYCPSPPPPIPGALVVADDLFSEIDSKGDSYIEAYPNPTTGHLTVNIITEGDPWSCLLEIYDFTGRRLIIRQLQTNETFEFDFSSYKNGIYFIKATWGGHMGIKRVIKH